GLDLDARQVMRLMTHLAASASIFRNSSQSGSHNILLSDGVLIADPFKEASEDAPRDRGPITLTASDFRGLGRVEWSPEGVCLVAGPNGSGKTTLLEAFAFLRDAFARGVTQAVRLQRGAVGLRHVGASGPPEVVLGLKVGDVSWQLRLTVDGGAV